MYLTDGNGMTEMVYARTIGFCLATFTMNSNRGVQAFFEINSE
ncbi:hypothetical protein N9605_06440 [Flavobacteriaceae bacterium]|jgi:hypothetical protein|nr:hypothetical protein [Flavobacteriaceae bacterium]